MTITLTHHHETLPTTQPVTGPQATIARAAAHQELAECRALLRTPGPLLASPRMRRRYEEAVAWVKMYETETNEKDVA